MIAVDRVAAAGVVHVILAVVRHEVIGHLVAEALEIDGGAEVVAFAGVVENGIDDHGDARPVQGFDHVAELADVGPLLGATQ